MGNKTSYGWLRKRRKERRASMVHEGSFRKVQGYRLFELFSNRQKNVTKGLNREVISFQLWAYENIPIALHGSEVVAYDCNPSTQWRIQAVWTCPQELLHSCYWSSYCTHKVGCENTSAWNQSWWQVHKGTNILKTFQLHSLNGGVLDIRVS